MPFPYLPSWLVVRYLLQGASAIQLLTQTTAPAGLSTACLGVLTADVACSRTVPRFLNGYFYSESTLSSSCTSECEVALAAYEANVVSSCAGDKWDGYDDEGGAPLAYIPSLLRYQYSLTCLKEGGRWCNVVTGDAAAFDDPGNSPIRFTDTTANGTKADPCDMCFVLSLRLQASVPFYDGPAIRSQSLYESKTSSCRVEGMPLTISSLPFSVLVELSLLPQICDYSNAKTKTGRPCLNQPHHHVLEPRTKSSQGMIVTAFQWLRGYLQLGC